MVLLALYWPSVLEFNRPATANPLPFSALGWGRPSSPKANVFALAAAKSPTAKIESLR